MPTCRRASLAVSSALLLLLQAWCAAGIDVLRGSLQPPGQHEAFPRPALLQTRTVLAHGHGVGPDFLGDTGPSNDVADVVPTSEHALPGEGKDIALAVQLQVASPEAMVAVQAKTAQSSPADDHAPEHAMHLLSTEQAGARDRVSVRFAHALEDANHVMTLLASGLSAGARAAVENVATPGTISWMVAADTSNHSAEAAPVPASAGGSPGAMAFFSDAARANATSRAVLRQAQAKPASLLASAMARAAASSHRARVDASGAHVDIMAPKQGSLSLEEQRLALLATEQRQDSLEAEAARTRDLERQSSLEDAMDRTRDDSGWGL